MELAGPRFRLSSTRLLIWSVRGLGHVQPAGLRLDDLQLQLVTVHHLNDGDQVERHGLAAPGGLRLALDRAIGRGMHDHVVQANGVAMKLLIC